MHQDDFDFVRDLPHAPSAEALDFMLRHIANSIEFDLANAPPGHFPVLTRQVCDKALAVTTLLAARQKTEHPEVAAAQLDPKTIDTLEEMQRSFAAMRKDVKESLDESAKDTHRDMAAVSKNVNERLEKSAQDAAAANKDLKERLEKGAEDSRREMAAMSKDLKESQEKSAQDMAAMSKDVKERLEKSAQDTHREIVSVTKNFDEMRRIKEYLEKMQAEKLFKFASDILPADFRVLCATLTAGNVAKAARDLNVPDATIRSRLAYWKTRGPTYKVLLDLVRWRKQIGQKGTVKVPESVLKDTASHTDFAGILSDVLEEVLAMTEDNWQEKAKALAELLRPLVPR